MSEHNLLKIKKLTVKGSNKMDQLTNIPENEIQQQIKNFILAGWVNILLTKQVDGSWTIKVE